MSFFNRAIKTSGSYLGRGFHTLGRLEKPVSFLGKQVKLGHQLYREGKQYLKSHDKSGLANLGFALAEQSPIGLSINGTRKEASALLNTTGNLLGESKRFGKALKQGNVSRDGFKNTIDNFANGLNDIEKTSERLARFIG
jgi:hypothetical protein